MAARAGRRSAASLPAASMTTGLSSGRTRLELWRSFSGAGGAGYWDVGEFSAIGGAAQEEAAAAHVAAPHEIGGKEEARAEFLEEDIDVFAGGDAAKEDDFRDGRKLANEESHRALERLAIARVLFVDVHFREGAQVV